MPPGCSVDGVVEQFATFQCVDISSCFDKNERMDAVWTAVGKLKDNVGEVYLGQLAVVMYEMTDRCFLWFCVIW